MKLTLDSQALERLIGGDTELEVKIRTDVANQFADKYLKSLVSSQLVATTGRDIENLVKSEILSGTQWSKTLSPKYREIAIQGVYEAMITLIQGEVKEILDSKLYKTRIDEFIERESNRIVSEWTAGNIEQRIQQAADNKIKQKLGI